MRYKANEYKSSRYQKGRKRKAKILLCFVCVFFLCTFLYFFCVVSPIVVNATESMIFSLSTSAVSDAVYEVLSEENVSYSDLINVDYDNDGNVSMITLETVNLNIISRKFYQVAQIYLDNMGKNGVDVPLGTFTGVPFLSGIGPKVNLKLVSIGAMTSLFESKFVSAGVNQTNHSVYVHLFASVSLILPAYSKTINSETEVLLAESVIIGKVPNVYMGNGPILNFSPS